MSEICVNCGKSVAVGSGNFVNRIPVLDDLETKTGIYQYPEGEYVCAECDNSETEEEEEEQKPMTFKEFAEKYKIKITSEWVDRNPNMKNSEREMDNWKTTLKMKKRQMTLFFSQGFGWKGAEPLTETVLNNLQADAYLIMDGYEWYLKNLGEEDTTKIRKEYERDERQEKKVRKFLGDLFEEFMELREE